ncbi:MAG TPA: transcriptional repressor [Chloroflexota bacterium]|jgi:Fur family ferric uptake transcriptional regulator|nr:transcriptional repressor [Chloroflexota bacterium]
MPGHGRLARSGAPLAPGLRQTLPRRLVWEALARIGPHCTAEEIAAELEARHVGLPRSSVYRALEALETSGAINAVHFGGGPARYEPSGEAHQHAVCQVCRGIMHLENALIRDLEEHLAHDHHFMPTRTDVTVLGICAGCADAGQNDAGVGTARNLEHVHYAPAQQQ